MDIELLFSGNPFVKEISGKFSYIRPNLEKTVKLASDKAGQIIALPEELSNNNVMVEIEAAGIKKSDTYYACSMNIQLIENYGQIKITHADTGKPIPTVYIKVYGLYNDNAIRFCKDGYTDPRGRFEYTSLSTNDLESVSKFSLLIMSENHGAVIREALPPKT